MPSKYGGIMNAWDINSLQKLEPAEFENLVKMLLLSMGFNASTTKATGDGGIDVLAINEQPIVGGKYVIQCKKYATGNNVGESAIRDLYGVMHAENANKGILITTSDFSNQAYSFSQGKAIELINGSSLLGLLYKYLPDLFDAASHDLAADQARDFGESLMREPSDFRGIDWGNNRSTHHDLIYFKEGGMGGSICHRVADSKKMGGASIDAPLYFFDDHDRFYSVQILYNGKDNYDELLTYLFRNYGKPSYSREYDHDWSWPSVKVSLFYNEDAAGGNLTLEYLPLWNEVQENHRRRVALTKSNMNKGAQCFVGSAIYGLNSPEVSLLRHWRDNFLARHFWGQQFIKFYYEIGPSLASYVSRHSTLKRVIQMILDSFIRIFLRRP